MKSWIKKKLKFWKFKITHINYITNSIVINHETLIETIGRFDNIIITLSERFNTRKKSRFNIKRNTISLLRNKKNIRIITSTFRLRSTVENSRRYPWLVLWFTSNFWIWKRATLFKLSIFRRLCRQREIIDRNNMFTFRL